MTNEQGPRRENWTRNPLVKTIFVVSLAVDAIAGTSKVGEAMSNNYPSENIPAAVGSPTPTPIESARSTTRINQSPTSFNACPAPETGTVTTKQVDNVRFGGLPDSTSNVLNADTASTPGVTFTHKIKGVGTENFYAEPGGLLVGADFESRFSGNPNGDNGAGWSAEWNSDGHINQFDAETHAILRSCPEFQLIPTGGLMEVIGNKFSVEVFHTDENGNMVSDNIKIDFGEVHGGINMLTIRGLFADMATQNNDRNRLALITNYVPGTVEVKMYKPGKKSNTAFISEGQFLQVVRDAHAGQTNCGTGCPNLEWVGIDLNAKSIDIAKQTAGQDGDFTQGWQKSSSNH